MNQQRKWVWKVATKLSIWWSRGGIWENNLWTDSTGLHDSGENIKLVNDDLLGSLEHFSETIYHNRWCLSHWIISKRRWCAVEIVLSIASVILYLIDFVNTQTDFWCLLNSCHSTLVDLVISCCSRICGRLYFRFVKCFICGYFTHSGWSVQFWSNVFIWPSDGAVYSDKSGCLVILF